MLTIIQGDWEERLKDIPDCSIDLTVTSPPYDDARTYGGHKWEFEHGAIELFRVMKPGGVVCWNVNDMVKDGSETLTSCKQKIFFVEQCGFRIHDTMIWEKTHVACPDSTRYHQMFEYVFILSKGKPKTFNRIADRPNKWAGSTPFSYNSKRLANGAIKKTREVEGRGKISDMGSRSNVWKGNSRAQEEPCHTLEHPAMMPKWIVRDMILSWSNPDDVVLDPMAGSGTVPYQAIATGRRAIAIEINTDYIPLIESACRVTPGLQLC